MSQHSTRQDRLIGTLLLTVWVCALSLSASRVDAAAYAPREALYEISTKDLSDEPGQITLPTRWRFDPADAPSHALGNFDDSGWAEVDTRLQSDERPATWQGIGWFRLRFRVSPGLRRMPLSMTIRQFGAAQIYLDGELLYAVGSVDPEPRATAPRLQRQPHLFSFDDSSEHVLAIRFANHNPEIYESVDKIAGFIVVLSAANPEVSRYAADERSLSAYQAFFTGLFAAFALLHLLFFAFYQQAEENLYFGLLSAAVALLVFLFFHSQSTSDPRFFQVYDRSTNLCWLAISVTGLRFVYGMYSPPTWRLRWILFVAIALAVPGWFMPKAAQPFVLLGLLLATAEMVRTVISANLRGQAGARVVGLGVVLLAVGILVGLAANLGLVPPSILTVVLVPFGSVLALILTMSVYLSQRFAQTNHELWAQLRQVRELSDQKLAQERRASEDDVRRRLLEAENRRQSEELEEARKLQLSMLPASLPELPHLEIAASMETATEVGGDYYDFDLADDGTLTVAIGDATGHGMKAGTLVTATKSLFKALDNRADLPETLGRFGRALKRMNLHQLCMALTLVRIKEGRLCLAAAGMPPALIHRAVSGAMETIEIGGMPLGSLDTFPYRQSEVSLGIGDTVLLMSDGFPERLNPDDEMLGYDKVREAFSRVVGGTPQAIVDCLVADGKTWADGRPAADDTTFLVLKMR